MLAPENPEHHFFIKYVPSLLFELFNSFFGGGGGFAARMSKKFLRGSYAPSQIPPSVPFSLWRWWQLGRPLIERVFCGGYAPAKARLDVFFSAVTAASNYNLSRFFCLARCLTHGALFLYLIWWDKKLEIITRRDERISLQITKDKRRCDITASAHEK